MEFSPADAPIPDSLRTAEFVLRPLRPADIALDYEAMMATQETLHLGGKWPRPGFTPEENRAHKVGHAADFRARVGFTFTVLEPDDTRCLGCAYVYPRAQVLRNLGVDGAVAAIDEGSAAVAWFWVRPDGVARDLDRRLLAALIHWLREGFGFTRLAFCAWVADERKVTLLREAGLRPVWSHPDTDAVALFFG